MREILAKQLALDYCCEVAEVLDREDHFHVFAPLDGRRRFDGDRPVKLAAVNGKLLCTGRREIVEELSQALRGVDAAWCFETDRLRRLDEILTRHGCRVGQVHPFFVAMKKTGAPAPDFDTVWYEREQIAQFQGDRRFAEAFSFLPDAPDVLGVAAVQDGAILGMAGASADSPYLWQIGIDTLPDARRTGVGTALVALLKNEVLARGKLPYYGTAVSHIASQRVAVKAGFLPAWAELLGEDME